MAKYKTPKSRTAPTEYEEGRSENLKVFAIANVLLVLELILVKFNKDLANFLSEITSIKETLTWFLIIAGVFLQFGIAFIIHMPFRKGLGLKSAKHSAALCFSISCVFLLLSFIWLPWSIFGWLGGVVIVLSLAIAALEKSARDPLGIRKR